MLPLTKDNQSLGIRVLSSKDNTPDPEILKFTNLTNTDLDIEFKKEKYAELKDENEKFKYVLLLVCKKLGRVIPQVFDGITDYIDILIPDNLLNDTGFITKIINEVPEDNYSQVEIIGWLYQYYNQTEKDRAMAKTSPYIFTEIPYVTQLFTPDWIVKYMVENSLGRYWIEHNGNQKVIDNWKYFINDNIIKNKNTIMPTEIKCIDPCCGSGHILVYMFEVLYQIYDSYGYSKNDIAELILKNNIYGLDIDDRAGQLSVLSILLKAREYDKNIFNKSVVKDLNVMSIKNSILFSNRDYLFNYSEEDQLLCKYLDETFRNAKELGSLIDVEEKKFDSLINTIKKDQTIFGLELKQAIYPLINQSKMLSKKYDVVITNPPYLNIGKANEILKKFLNDNYPYSKADLSTAFMEKCLKLTIEQGYTAMINIPVWMFLTTYEKFRKQIVMKYDIASMIHNGRGIFGSDFGTTAFVIKNSDNKDFLGIYKKLFTKVGDVESNEEKEKRFFNTPNISKNKKDYKMLPGNQISYWVSEQLLNAFKYKSVQNYIEPIEGYKTGENEKFLKFIWEVNGNDIGKLYEKDKKWYLTTKGGAYRKWYGNIEYVVNYYNNGEDLKKFKKSSLYKDEYNTKLAITWTYLTAGSISFRYLGSGYLYNNKGPAAFGMDERILKYIMALINSKVGTEILNLICSTLTYLPGDIRKIPVIEDLNIMEKIIELVNENINISRNEWDSYEMSWDFEKHPFIKYKQCSIEKTYNEWNKITKERFNQLKTNEEEINKIFINIYGLQDELDFKVNCDEISIKLANTKRDVKSFINYAVGCMFGRYSLDESGLVYAGGEFDSNRYKTYKADIDNIIPITDDGYFNDDIVERFKKFIEVVYGKETLNENIDYIAETLGKKGTETSEDTIRRYFVNDFFNDHVRTYQKHPIYWLFDSGKKNGFKALIYMHRYNENLIPKVRLDYLHRLQTTYEKLLTDVNYKLTTDLSMQEKKMTQLKQTELNAKLQEIREYDEKIAHIANQRISIDLDDGVKVNYDKFKDILAKIK